MPIDPRHPAPHGAPPASEAAAGAPGGSSLRAGALVGGYRLLRRLGSGGMGTVWQARDAEGATVAMKILHPQIAADPVARQRLAREAQVLARVRSPHVARILDIEAGSPSGSPSAASSASFMADAAASWAPPLTFVVTEYVDGPTLQAEVDAGGPYSLASDAADLADMAHGLVRALDSVHAAGVIHRDLKPSNVMLGPAGPVLIDFGIAQLRDDVRLTQTGLVTGTPGFISPEVLGGAELTPAVDWYACAAVLLFAVTGRPPFGTGPWEAVFHREYTGQPELGDLPRLWPELAQAFTSALAPNPEDRLEVRDLVRVLDAVAEGGATTVLPVGLSLVGADLEGEQGSEFFPEPEEAATSLLDPGEGATASLEMLPPSVPPGGAVATPPAPDPSWQTPALASQETAVLGGPGFPAVEDATSLLPEGDTWTDQDGASMDDAPTMVVPPGYPGFGDLEATSVMPAALPGVPQGSVPGTAPGTAWEGDDPAWQASPPAVGALPAGYGAPQVPVELPEWARQPRRQRGIGLAAWLLVAAMGASAPHFAVILALMAAILCGTVGRAANMRRRRRLDYGGTRWSDTSWMWAASPLYLLQAAVVSLAGGAIGGVVGVAAAYLLGLEPEWGGGLGIALPWDASLRAALGGALAVGVTCGVMWLIPWNVTARRGGDRLLAMALPSGEEGVRKGSGLLACLLVALAAAIVVAVVGGQLPSASLGGLLHLPSLPAAGVP